MLKSIQKVESIYVWDVCGEMRKIMEICRECHSDTLLYCHTSFGIFWTRYQNIGYSVPNNLTIVLKQRMLLSAVTIKDQEERNEID